MKTFKVDGDGFIDTSSNSIELVTESEALVAIIKQKYKMNLKEYYLDTRLGIPYFDQVLIKSYNLRTLENIFKRVLLNFDEIVEIRKFSVVPDDSTRILTVSFECLTESGLINEEIQI